MLGVDTSILPPRSLKDTGKLRDVKLANDSSHKAHVTGRCIFGRQVFSIPNNQSGIGDKFVSIIVTSNKDFLVSGF